MHIKNGTENYMGKKVTEQAVYI